MDAEREIQVSARRPITFHVEVTTDGRKSLLQTMRRYYSRPDRDGRPVRKVVERYDGFCVDDHRLDLVAIDEFDPRKLVFHARGATPAQAEKTVRRAIAAAAEWAASNPEVPLTAAEGLL